MDARVELFHSQGKIRVFPCSQTNPLRNGPRQFRPRNEALPIPPAGFEPATGGLEIRCSIQLSYEGSTRRFLPSTRRNGTLPRFILPGGNAVRSVGPSVYFFFISEIPQVARMRSASDCNRCTTAGWRALTSVRSPRSSSRL